jgi:transitional endoplasmic reticulum ATPase
MAYKLSSRYEMSLKVCGAYSRDPGNGVARIGCDIMDLLNISPGDFIEIKNEDGRRTVAKCSSLAPRDEGKAMIRIDGFTRHNLGLGTPQRGKKNKDIVTIRKIMAVPAEKVVFTSATSIPQINEDYLMEYLENMPLIKGDDITVRYFGGELAFRVTDVTPDDVVIISQKTAFRIDGICFISKEEWEKQKKPWNTKQLR